MKNLFGEYLKRLRLERKLTLRAFCERNGFDPGNYSKVERGILPPPADATKIELYRKALNLAENSQEWLELQRLSAISRGEIPARLLSNAKLTHKLPALFRTLEGEQVSDEELDEFIATLRGQ